MRKISWLSMGCIAAFVVQALVAADGTRTSASKNSDTGRSRLMIYSRSKEKVRAPAPQAEDEVGQASLSTADVDEDAPPQKTPRTGNTGTVSPSGATARASAARQALPAKSSSVSTRRTPTTAMVVARPKVANDQVDEAQADEKQLRQMFGEDPTDGAGGITRTVISKTPDGRIQAATGPVDPFDDTESVKLKAGSASRYRDLLESVRPGSERPVTPKAEAKQNKIVPVSRTSEDHFELEVNPFEPSERPSKVINAGFEADSGKGGPRRVQPVSATVPLKTLQPGKVQHLPVAKPVATKHVESTKQPAKPATGVAKSTVVATTSAGTTLNASQSPQVDVKWEARGEVTLGQECQCALVVQNNGKAPCQELVVEATLPESVRLVDSNPFPQSSSSKLEWQFANLAVGEKKTIELTIIPTKPGELAASAQVRFTGTAATSFRVSEPMLTTTIKVPGEIQIGESTSAMITIQNPGTGTAQNVVVKATLPAGLECSSGQDFVAELGSLEAGGTKVFRLSLTATGGGDHSLKVVAHSGTSDLEGTAQAKLKVLAPHLKLSAAGPSLRYLNRATKYVLTATNDSNAACDNVRITQTIAPGFEFVKADHSGRWDAQSRTVSWFIGHLDPAQTTAVELELLPQEIGEFKQEFHITGDSGVAAKSVVTTRVEGAASLVMEVKDGEDPIEVGSNMTYSICVRNEGSKSAGKVAISCELPPDVELVSVDGPTQHLVESGMLIFKPVAEVAANDSVTFKVTIKGTAAGTTKLRARLTSESIQKPLIVEEATQFYAE